MTLIFLEMKLSGLYEARKLYIKSLTSLKTLEATVTSAFTIEEITNFDKLIITSKDIIIKMQPKIDCITKKVIYEFQRAGISPEENITVTILRGKKAETWYTKNGTVEVILKN